MDRAATATIVITSQLPVAIGIVKDDVDLLVKRIDKCFKEYKNLNSAKSSTN